MTKKEIFKKYSINESHNIWDDRIDNWMSVEIYRVMHNGNLPPSNDKSTDWVYEFMAATERDEFMFEFMKRPDWGSLYLTAKRLIYFLLKDQK